MKKWYLVLCSILLVLSLLLTGCTTKPEHHEENSVSDEDDSSYDENSAFDDCDKEYENVPDDVLNKSFMLRSDKGASFRELVSQLEVTYDWLADTDIEKCLNAYYALKTETVPDSATIIKNRKVDEVAFLKAVEANSAANQSLYYTQMPKALVEKVAQYIIDAVNYQLSINPYIRIDVLDAKLKELKIMYYNAEGYGVYDQNAIALALNSSCELTEAEMREVVTHEAYHIVQNAKLKKEDVLEMNFGMCYQFSDIELNYLYWVWYVEGAAQGNAMQQLDIKTDNAFVYMDYVRNMECLNTTIALVNDNVYDLYYMSAQSELESFFGLFNCQTEKDKRDIIKMMVTFNLMEEAEVILSRPFFDKTKLDEDMHCRKRFSAVNAQMLTKIFYQNLVTKLESKEVKLSDVFSLISSFESYISCMTWYSSAEAEAFMDGFYKTYTYIQGEFFKLLTTETELTAEQLQKYYTDFHHTVDHTNYKNALLNEKQQGFYKEVYRGKYFSLPLTVYEAAVQYGN